jgi:hypothetical protein
VKTNQRGGIGETAPAELGQELLRAKAVAWLEAAHQSREAIKGSGKCSVK